MFKVLVLALMHNPSDERMEFLIRDRLVNEPTPDRKTIRLFREKLTRAGAFRSLFAAFEEQIRSRGYRLTGGRIVDATPISAPRRRMTREEKECAKAGESASDIWSDVPARASRKDTDARWTIRHSGAKRTGNPGEDAGMVDIAVPHFGYRNQISIERKRGFIRGENGTDAAGNDGRELRSTLDRDNGCGKVRADTDCRSADNERWLDANGFKSCIHRRKPRGKPMPKHIRRGNATRSSVRAHVEHVFDCRKGPMGFTIRCIGRIRAAGRITMANLTCNFRRACGPPGRTPAARFHSR